jgi:16S rRNA processing protein RimM
MQQRKRRQPKKRRRPDQLIEKPRARDDPMTDSSPLLLVCEIGPARGLRGEVRARSYTADPEALGDYGPLQSDDGRQFTVRHVQAAKGGVVVQFAEIPDRTAAEALRGLKLYLDRAALPDALDDDDEFYHVDLIGLDVFGPDDVLIGTVTAVQDFGAGDLLDVELSDGRSVLIPFTREIVPQVDLATRRIDAVPPPGLLDDDEPSPFSSLDEDKPSFSKVVDEDKPSSRDDET